MKIFTANCRKDETKENDAENGPFKKTSSR